MKVIDSAESAAEAAARLFGQQDADAPSTAPQALRCFATDSVRSLSALVPAFLAGPSEMLSLSTSEADILFRR